MKKIAFLFSGRGSLIGSVVEGIGRSSVPAEVALVITNNKAFPAENGSLAGRFPVSRVLHSDFADRESFEAEISRQLDANDIDLIVLGGFRRIFSPAFVDKYGSRTINTHPSILPAFPGDGAQRRALEAGVKVTGATVHFINNEVDAGPIIDQGVVRIAPGMTEQALKEAIIKVEEVIIADAVTNILEDRIAVRDGIVRVVQ
ncbi:MULTISPECIES: phosphoribosylglycinamide formyltransferase [unclassified Burkholderia]|uniref:phosphoribosylglycinamide formyltransferase n=1 Tax=unclassified Burkholderia TaxID=2613784 RepID=UPI000752B2DB|nr:MULTISPECIES: phosphoribosylglycinamide formyltransferase [unclassified Burkholderia]KVN14494.1 phosphoribosylglycinamide formyltransferase [Burkholderia sp. MSMB1552]KWZ55998.1 phosphoribosylglycinamide formyltransferase [Burkholderia sp. MSMB1588]